MPSSSTRFSNSVFINCPFDRDYQSLFEALVFCVLASGFTLRCALADADAGEPRIRRIERMIAASRYSIHDLSRIELTPDLPRFNMPFELGLDLGCRAFGEPLMTRKRCMILDSKPYRYQQVLSDISGQDIRAHGNSVDELIVQVSSWLRSASRRRTIPGPRDVRQRFARFVSVLPALCEQYGLDRDAIQFHDYVILISESMRPRIGRR